MKKNQWYNNQIFPWLLPIVIVILWQVLGQLNLIKSTMLPTPFEVVEAGIRLFQTGELQENVYISTKRAVIGFAIGGAIGFLLGLFNGTILFFLKN